MWCPACESALAADSTNVVSFHGGPGPPVSFPGNRQRSHRPRLPANDQLLDTAVVGTCCRRLPRPLSSTLVLGRPPNSLFQPSASVCCRPQASFLAGFRDWLQIGYTAADLPKCERKKEAPQIFAGLGLTPAEGTGLEPATPCGAPHFQFYWTCVHYRPLCPKTYTVAGLRDRQIPPTSSLSTDVRRFGYKLATRGRPAYTRGRST
jgi:hypothetical protein